MKKLIVVGTIFIFSSCTQNSKYKIVDSTGNSHYTDSFLKREGGCIEFTEDCLCDSGNSLNKVTLCGSYSITENPQL